MNYIYTFDNYGRIIRDIHETTHPEVMVSLFNHEFNHKHGILHLLSMISMEGGLEYSVVQGILEEMEINGVNVRTMGELSMNIINHYDKFWDSVQAKKANCLSLAEIILGSYPRLLALKYGKPVAFVTQDEDIDGLKNIAYTERLGHTFFAHYTDYIAKDGPSYRRLRNRCADDTELYEMHMASVADSV